MTDSFGCAPGEGDGRCRVPRNSLRYALDLDRHAEAPINHALAIERHPFRLHHLLEARIFHDLRVYAVALLTRPEHDPGEDDGLSLFDLDATREGRHLAHLHVVGDALAELDRTQLSPNLPRFAPSRGRRLACLRGRAQRIRRRSGP